MNLNTNLNSLASSLNNVGKRETYIFIAILIHFAVPYYGSDIIGNFLNGLFSTNGTSVYTFFWYALLGVSGLFFLWSFHKTKPDIWAVYFVFGDMVGILSSGGSYVPLGFFKGVVQEYTKSWINFTETINVVKLTSAKAFKYKMEIKIEGALRIVDPMKFFLATGLKGFNRASFDREIDKFYSTVIADLSSNIDTIAADWGYAEFRKKTDWTLEDILRESKKITGESQDSLRQTFLDFGLGFDKISTYTKYDKEIEDVLVKQAMAEAQRIIDVYEAETKKLVKEKDAEAEVEVAKLRAKAIEEVTLKIASLPRYKNLTAAEVKEMVEAVTNIWDNENLNKNIIDIKGLAELVPIIEKLLTAFISKK